MRGDPVANLGELLNERHGDWELVTTVQSYHVLTGIFERPATTLDWRPTGPPGNNSTMTPSKRVHMPVILTTPVVHTSYVTWESNEAKGVWPMSETRRFLQKCGQVVAITIWTLTPRRRS